MSTLPYFYVNLRNFNIIVIIIITFVVLKPFLLFWRWQPVIRASYRPRNAVVITRSRPRTSDVAWAPRMVAGPYFSALLPEGCHFHTFCFTTAWNSSVGFASWAFGNSIASWIFDSKLLMCQRIIVLHINDSLQVVFAARFVWRRHSNTTTLRFQWKPCDLFFLINYVILHFCDFVTKFGEAIAQDFLVRLTWKYFSMCGI